MADRPTIVLDESLPPGWECFKDAGGQLYYYHEVSGKTTFDKPDRETLPKGWEEYKDGEGRAYYYNAASGETSWEFPDPDLPTGWEAFQDENGRNYYYNEDSGETSWDHPSLAGDAQKQDGDGGLGTMAEEPDESAPAANAEAELAAKDEKVLNARKSRRKTKTNRRMSVSSRKIKRLSMAYELPPEVQLQMELEREEAAKAAEEASAGDAAVVRPKIKLRAVAHALIFYHRLAKNAKTPGKTVLQILGESETPTMRETRKWEFAGDEEETVVVRFALRLCFGFIVCCG
jgi:hypothetical protein